MPPDDSVVFLPDWRSQNPYQTLMAQGLAHAGVRVGFHAMPKGLFGLNRLPREVLANRVVHLHWINDLIGHTLWPQNPWIRLGKQWCLAFDILLLRARGHRIE